MENTQTLLLSHVVVLLIIDLQPDRPVFSISFLPAYQMKGFPLFFISHCYSFFSFPFSFFCTKSAILRHRLGLSHYNVSHFSQFFPIPVGGFPNTLSFQLHAFFATTVSSFVLCTKTKQKSSYESESWSLNDESSSFKGQLWFLAMLVHFVLQRLLSTIWLWVSE